MKNKVKPYTQKSHIELIKAGDIFYHGDFHNFFVLEKDLRDGLFRLRFVDKSYVSLVFPIKVLVNLMNKGQLVHLPL
jgi:hypothetical protein